VTKEDGASEEIDATTEELYISNRKITEIDFSGLTGNEILTDLTLRNTSITTLDISPLSSCTNLKTLNLFNNNKLRILDLAPLSGCLSIQSLFISFEEGIQNLDLSPLSRCNNIQTLVISLRHIKEIDLSALSGCHNLERLTIQSNYHLQSLDLSPLSSCPNFRILRIGSNSKLKSLDLSPLRSCPKFHQLLVDLNEELEELDLSPLSDCHRLSSISVTKSPKLQLDLFPLFWCKNLGSALVYSIANIVSDPMLALHPASLFRSAQGDGPHISELIESFVDTHGWRHLYDYYEAPKHLYPDQAEFVQIEWGWKFLEVLGMADLIGYDRTIDALLTYLLDLDFKSGCEYIYDAMLTRLGEQLERGGTTIFMDVEKMSTTKAAGLISRILELRESEMQGLQMSKREEVVDVEREEFVDLTSLALTAYGFKILYPLETHYLVPIEDLESINKWLQEANLPPVELIDEEVTRQSHISDAMFEIVSNRLGWERE
jgi:hypothetical protein